MQVDANIMYVTFFPKYTGEVDYLENKENDGCDSIMTLLSPANPSKKHVICHDKRGTSSTLVMASTTTLCK